MLCYVLFYIVFRNKKGKNSLKWLEEHLFLLQMEKELYNSYHIHVKANFNFAIEWLLSSLGDAYNNQHLLWAPERFRGPVALQILHLMPPIYIPYAKMYNKSY